MANIRDFFRGRGSNTPPVKQQPLVHAADIREWFGGGGGSRPVQPVVVNTSPVQPQPLVNAFVSRKRKADLYPEEQEAKLKVEKAKTAAYNQRYNKQKKEEMEQLKRENETLKQLALHHALEKCEGVERFLTPIVFAGGGSVPVPSRKKPRCEEEEVASPITPEILTPSPMQSPNIVIDNSPAIKKRKLLTPEQRAQRKVEIDRACYERKKQKPEYIQKSREYYHDRKQREQQKKREAEQHEYTEVERLSLRVQKLEDLLRTFGSTIQNVL